MNLSTRFLDYFAELDDPRRCYGNKRHELRDILVLTILAVISGAESWVDVEEFGIDKEDWLKSFLQLPNGIPSHDTIGRVFSRINPECLEKCFLGWVKSLIRTTDKEVIAIDGKTVRRSYNGEHRAIHMVKVPGRHKMVWYLVN